MEPIEPKHIGYATDVGKLREENQDSVAVRQLPSATLLLVADGMGGHLGGSLASRLAADVVIQEIEGGEPQWNDPHQVNSLLEQALLKANTEVHRAARANREAHNMGTTVVAAVVVGKQVHVAHVGDSRLYLVRNGRSIRLTRDHTSAQVLLDAGKLTPDQVRGHPESHRLMRAVGIAPRVEPDVRREPLRLQEFDTLLLCSDGLYDVVDGREIARAVMRFPPAEACRRLIDLANDRGGPDNITVVVYSHLIRDSVGERLAAALSREVKGLPVWIWGLAGASLTAAAVLLGLAFR